jgi:hypothetical protein
VYHDNDKCAEGSSIPALYRAEGTVGRPLCKTCATLNATEGEPMLVERNQW